MIYAKVPQMNDLSKGPKTKAHRHTYTKMNRMLSEIMISRGEITYHLSKTLDR